MGLHPWHPDIQNLSPHQLHWALLQAEPDRREDHKKLIQQRETQPALDFIAWFDAHVSS